MSKTKNEHYLPQSYVKRFGQNDKIDVYNKSKGIFLHNQTPKNFASIRFFYDFKLDDISEYLDDLFEIFPKLKDKISQDEQFLEHYLSRVEGEVVRIFDALEKDPNKIEDDAFKSKIIIYLHDLAYRTESVRAFDEKINNVIYNSLIDFYPEDHLSQFKKESSKKKQIFNLIHIRPLLYTMHKLMENYDWYIGTNNSEKINFIISDNPALDVELGFNDICFPISNKFALIFKIKDPNAPVLTHDKCKKNIIYLSEKSVLIYNCWQFSKVSRFAFGDFNSLIMAYSVLKKWNKA